MCENAPDHLVSRVRRLGFFSFGLGWVRVFEFLAWIVLIYCENIDEIHFQFLSSQSKSNVTSLITYPLETKIARASTLPEMDRNFEQ